MKKVLLSFITVIVAGLFISPAFAAGDKVPTPTPTSHPCPKGYGGHGPYGGPGCPPATIAVDKRVQHPQTGAFVDNLRVTDPKYAPADDVLYRIEVRNPNATELTNVILTDIFPAEGVIYVANSAYSYDPKTRKVTVKIDRIGPGETRTFDIAARTSVAETFTKETVCDITNAVRVEANGVSDTDEASICVQKTVLPGTTKGGQPVFPAPPATITPKTGAEMLSLISLLPGALGGYYLRRRATMRK